MDAATPLPYDVYISYSQANRPWVHDWLLPHLEDSGLRVCLDTRNFDVGVPELVNIENAVTLSRKILLVLTPAWLASEGAHFESLLIQAQDPAGIRRRTLPLMLEPCQPPQRISIYTHADFTDPGQWEVQLGRIVDAIRDRVYLPTHGAPLSQLSSRPPADTSTNNLPTRLTSFVGREDEKAAVRQALATAHLVTITGAPGAGKTRLALEVAGEVVERFADGAWLVELAALPAAAPVEAVALAVANVLGVREEPGRPLLGSLGSYLRCLHILLVLDNCEHLAHACAAFANALLPGCPEMRILATSREALRVPGGLDRELAPLSLPSEDERRLSPEVLTKSEAGRLFVERARLSQPTFEVTKRNAPAVAAICRRLAGLPLAIELVAAWVKSLSVEQIAVRLKDRLWQLAAGARDARPQHQTLQDAITWSYELLSAQERILFDRLAAFAGGFPLEAAEVVAAGGDVAPLDVFQLLLRLIDRSLVRAEAGADAAMRYRLLEPLREYAWEQLAEMGEAAIICGRHAAFFLALVEETEPRLEGPDQIIWQRRLQVEHDNLRAALGWMIGAGEAEDSLRLAGALSRFWRLQGYLSEGRRWLEQALGQGEATPPVTAKALLGAGMLAYYQGDLPAATELLRQSLELTDPARVSRVRAGALYFLGEVTHRRGNFADAGPLFEEGLAIQRALGDQRGVADSLTSLGTTAMFQGDYTAARASFEESLSVFKALKHALGVANAATTLGEVACLQGDFPAATRFLDESLAIYRELGSRDGIAISLTNLGEVALAQGDYVAAQKCFREALVLAQELGAKEGIAYLLEDFAELSVAQAGMERGVRLFGAAEALREAISAPLPADSRPAYDHSVAVARTQLDQASFTGAWNEGRAMPLEDAIYYALDGRPDDIT